MAAQSQSHRVKVTIDVSEDERTYIKMLATKRRMTISEFINVKPAYLSMFIK